METTADSLPPAPGLLATGYDVLEKIQMLVPMVDLLDFLDEVGGELEEDEIKEDAMGYAYDRISDSARAYMGASVGHLGALKDLLEPQLEYLRRQGKSCFPARSEEGEIRHVRSLLMLCRAGLEGAAQALLLLKPDSSADRIKNHMQLVFVDLNEEISAQGEIERETDPAVVKREFTARYGHVPRFGYKALVREAAVMMGEDPDSWERMWRGASAATHGRVWVNYSMTDVGPAGLLSLASAATNTLCESFKFFMQRGAVPIATLCMDDILGELMAADPDVWFASIR
ncbi:hypothetical protein [Pseudarthrobacter sp. BIM B-2242]|uniref:hypothetical protein n=1 Tax=Pseudarthrobacter sp. BIM B-2242 TaxID=2772401 RepID=UPI00168B515F|nr:hypothetical protein [Pseudarthrobacter sp. BIM B-2242]QOD06143.1 hypothetical protein IDT60_21530 [Pseudarthrobacter sp. BIM B-2242]